MGSEDETTIESDNRDIEDAVSDKIKRDSANSKRSIGRELLGNIAYILVIILLTFLAVQFLGQRTQVKGSSMETTLSNNDNLIVDKISYRFRDPERYDIIVFPYQYKEDTFYIKRIIGLPGETIQIVDGVIYIDGEVLEEDYGREVMNTSGRAAEPITLATDEYFVLGDNRNESADSRETGVGNIKRENIIGRAWLRIWPLNKFGILKHQ